MRELTGSESSTPHVILSSIEPSQWQDALWAFLKGTNDQFGAFALVLAVVGLGLAWKRDWRTTLVLFVSCTAALLFAVTYVAEGDTDRYRLLALWMIAPLMAVAAPSRDDIANGLGRFLLCVFLAVGAWKAFAAGQSFTTTRRRAKAAGGSSIASRRSFRRAP